MHLPSNRGALALALLLAAAPFAAAQAAAPDPIDALVPREGRVLLLRLDLSDPRARATVKEAYGAAVGEAMFLVRRAYDMLGMFVASAKSLEKEDVEKLMVAMAAPDGPGTTSDPADMFRRVVLAVRIAPEKEAAFFDEIAAESELGAPEDLGDWSLREVLGAAEGGLGGLPPGLRMFVLRRAGAIAFAFDRDFAARLIAAQPAPGDGPDAAFLARMDFALASKAYATAPAYIASELAFSVSIADALLASYRIAVGPSARYQAYLSAVRELCAGRTTLERLGASKAGAPVAAELRTMGFTQAAFDELAAQGAAVRDAGDGAIGIDLTLELE